MPRHLPAALAELSSWPRSPEPSRAETPSGQALIEYLRAVGAWSHLGIELPEPLREQVASLWSSRPELRSALAPVLGGNPCPQFLRAVRRELERGSFGDMKAWFSAYPELGRAVKPFVLERARRFRQSFVALDACIVWGRYLDGGDEAWRQAACVIKADERVRARHPRPHDAFRHDLEDHGTLAPEEADAINRFLEQLQATPLEPVELGRWWQFNDDVTWRSEANRGRILEGVARTSIHFAAQHGNAWSEDDERFYAERLAALPRHAARGFRADNETLRRILARAEAASSSA